MAENVNPMLINTISTNKAKLYEPKQDDMKYYNDKDGYLQLLIKEVISNGFEKELYLQNDDGKKQYSILKIYRLYIITSTIC